MREVGLAYAACRSRIADLVRGLDGEAAIAPVPACPGWSVADVVAHLTGVVDDALAGRLEGAATEAWTAAQVQARRGRPIAEVLAEWGAQAAVFEELLDGAGDPGRQAVADIVTHEHDIRGALRRPGARSSDAVRIGVGFLAPGLVASAGARGVSLQVRGTDGSQIGSAEAAVRVMAEPFELLRALTGRRSMSQLRALQWDGDPEPVLPAFTWGPFRPAPEPLHE